MLEKLEKAPNQNIDVEFFQTREPSEWKARIRCGKEEYVIGPAKIGSILNNVANFVSMESTYADLLVHGAEAVLTANPTRPRKKSERKPIRAVFNDE